MASPMADDAEPPPPDDPVQVGLEQFQRAALEAIRAGRAMLDAAETMLQDPQAAETLVRTVTDVARTATETVAGFAARGWPARSTDRGDEGDSGSDDDGPGSGFERISVD
jgi:hypothetical protein